MDLFRSKKRDVDQACLEAAAGLQKKHHTLSGSLDDLLHIDKYEEDGLGTASENTASESEDDENDVNKASKKQKAFAKISIKREKRKEKEQRKKSEKNLISMDDFLGKQAEFKMWLYEEKSKNAGEMASPKLKVYFKQFVRLWNKRKLASKYYRSSTLPESPAPLTPKKFNFLSEDEMDSGSPLQVDQANEVSEKETPTSPFITFGKTPPKVFRSKKFQLFGSSKEVALLSVAPIGSPQISQTQKENLSKEQYQVPKVPKRKDSSEEKTKMPRGATPYKVSVFPWASTEVRDYDSDDKLDICSTDTPPSLSFQEDQVEESWPPPPSETELLGDHTKSTRDSPHVPPPPPPRLESLQKSSTITKSPKLAGNYADPYDKLSEIQSGKCKREVNSDYQDPVDCVPLKGHRTVADNARMVLQSLSGNDEPDLSLYSKPVPEKRFSKEELEELYAKPLKKAKRNDIGGIMESKENTTQKPEDHSDLYNEIMEHINKSSTEEKDTKKHYRPDPDYETIEECQAIIKSTKAEMNCSEQIGDDLKKSDEIPVLKSQKDEQCNQKFATISKAKKMRVMAASTEKIYETYLSLGRKSNPFKNKMDAPKPQDNNHDFSTGMFTQSLKAKSKSQPDISFSEGLQHFDIDINKDKDFTGSALLMSSFKPVENQKSNCLNEVRLKDSDRAKSCEDCLRNVEEPRTPTIMATPSFDSLCDVTPLSCKTFSSQSLPTKSGSSESLTSHSYMSISTSSSLSFGPDEKSGSLQSLHSEKSLSPVREEEEFDMRYKGKDMKEKPEIGLNPNIEKGTPTADTENKSSQKEQKTNEGKSVDSVHTCSDITNRTDNLMPLTPGKISALKHGIDLSVYLLKPTKQEGKEKGDVSVKEQKHRETSVGDSSTGKPKRVGESNCTQKLFDTQSRLAIKEKLSGVKTKVDQGKSTSKKEIERRHTVQTVQEITEKPDEKSVIPNIGITSKTRKVDTFSKGGKTKFIQGKNGDDGRSQEPNSKRHCSEKKRVMSVDDHYLETDLDKVLTDKRRKPMKKSKSHSGLTGNSGVVTDIW